ncbi:hypothetical protein RRG08_008239 [Elysia crispata]|uniref:Uncharacterized protein n=1 Tax=Elysia crispata TaxID=231223 RepID=A0AAE0YB77_9GAST|nr:hypothetical protein RRG08_008239 [Elysia crispata]
MGWPHASTSLPLSQTTLPSIAAPQLSTSAPLCPSRQLSSSPLSVFKFDLRVSQTCECVALFFPTFLGKNPASPRNPRHAVHSSRVRATCWVSDAAPLSRGQALHATTEHAGQVFIRDSVVDTC